MNQMVRAHQFVDRMGRLAPVEAILRRRYDRRFESNRTSNLFRGVFGTFEEARDAAPANLPVGYDNPSSASMYMERTRTIHSTDYPVMFWLQKLLADGRTRIFDLGGHIGVSYYAYRPYLHFPEALRWVVHDVPAVVAAGRSIAAEKDAGGNLSFCERFEDAQGMDVLMALGSLQYLPQTLAERLRSLPSPPGHLLLNMTPLHPHHSYFTLQSIRTAYCPYRITAIDDFLGPYEELGYRLVDRWENPEKRCFIPFHPERSLDRYHGFYFRLGA